MRFLWFYPDISDTEFSAAPSNNHIPSRIKLFVEIATFIWFHKKGFGKVYREGLKEGFKTLHKIKKVPFKWRHFINYVHIEWLLIKNTFKYIVDKIGR